jgi:antitoxin (DNA-binding transcriptional repressor) of toxin-antitoxin stability system
VITLQEAQARLPELIADLQPGAELIISDQGKPVAKLTRAERTSWPCQAGSAAGKIWMAPDFDAPLDEFKEYME